MGLKVAESGGNFKQIDPGMYVGLCYRSIDLGTQHEEYNNEVKINRKVFVSWEFPDELITEGEFTGQPYSMSKFYTASLHEKANLRKDLESWRGRAFTADELSGFDLDNILGKPCMVNVITNDKGKSVIAGIMPLPKGTDTPTGVNDIFSFSFDEWDEEKFDGISDGIKRIMMESDEYKNINMVGEVMNEDVPPAHTDEDLSIPF